MKGLLEKSDFDLAKGASKIGVSVQNSEYDRGIRSSRANQQNFMSSESLAGKNPNSEQESDGES